MLEAISAREIAVTGLKAQRTRMNVIANNIANAQTTRTPNGGGPFRRQVAILHGHALDKPIDPDKFGVRVRGVTRDPSPLRTVFDPSHPDANEEGYVAYPNVDVAMEMVNLVVAHRAYDANLAVVSADKRMAESALQIIQG